MVVERKAQIQRPWEFVLLIEFIMLGQFPTVKDFWPDKSPWSEDLKWISLSTTMGKCPFSIFEAPCICSAWPWNKKCELNAVGLALRSVIFYINSILTIEAFYLVTIVLI